jgi:hypothetical protein
VSAVWCSTAAADTTTYHLRVPDNWQSREYRLLAKRQSIPLRGQSADLTVDEFDEYFWMHLMDESGRIVDSKLDFVGDDALKTMKVRTSVVGVSLGAWYYLRLGRRQLIDTGAHSPVTAVQLTKYVGPWTLGAAIGEESRDRAPGRVRINSASQHVQLMVGTDFAPFTKFRGPLTGITIGPEVDLWLIRRQVAVSDGYVKLADRGSGYAVGGGVHIRHLIRHGFGVQLRSLTGWGQLSLPRLAPNAQYQIVDHSMGVFYAW